MSEKGANQSKQSTRSGAFAAQDFSPLVQGFAQAGQQLLQNFLQYLGQQSQFVGSGADAAQAAQASLAAGKAPAVPAPADLEALKNLQQEFLARHMKLWQGMLGASQGQGADESYRVAPEPGDRRFSAPAWRTSPVFDFMHQAYLINADYVRRAADLVPAETEKARDRLRFLARQYTDALSPSNYAATNPEFVETALATEGRSITEGINQLIADLEKGRITMTDEAQFEVGRNLATTPGSVVYENEFMQLIQYAPQTERVGEQPLLIVPPCINKFYILDLQPENSLVRFAVEQGHTVFLISWRNPQAEQGHWTWDDYLEKAVITAIRVVQEISGAKKINALGFCVGGTILSSALGVLAARRQQPVASLTLLTTFLDFHDTGEIGLFIDDASVRSREASIGGGGLLTARELSTTFSSLRANDLVWSYVANHYLKGKKPQAFDLLYWNSDSTNLPGPFAAWYMRNLYLDNALKDPGRLSMCGVKVNLSKLKMPAYLLAAREDHIVPWQSAYRSVEVLGGPCRFVLGASGHIAGVVNPASKNKRSYWVGGDQSQSAEGWLASAPENPGSWWADWAMWLDAHRGQLVDAPTQPGNARYGVIEPAPGRYVKEKAL